MFLVNILTSTFILLKANIDMLLFKKRLCDFMTNYHIKELLKKDFDVATTVLEVVF